MLPKDHASTAASCGRRGSSMDPAMKAGIGATAGSVLIVAVALLVMQILPVSTG
jgi:hypothetical protein